MPMLHQLHKATGVMYKCTQAASGPGKGMLKSKVPVIAVFLTLNAGMYAQEKKPFVLLPDSAARNLSRLCSRKGMTHVDAIWRPTIGDIQLLESRLANISRLRSEAALNGVSD